MERLPIQYFPPLLISSLVDLQMGKGLALSGHRNLHRVVWSFLKAKPVFASDVTETYRNSKFSFNTVGAENCLFQGPAVFMGNHTRLGPLDGMGQYFELASVIAEARRIAYGETREPFVVMQRGLSLPTKWLTELSGQFYDLGGQSLNWEVVQKPEFRDGKITNEQGLSPTAYQRIKNGEVMILYPQGRHRPPYNLEFPERTTFFIRKLRTTCPETLLVPFRVLPGEDEYKTNIFIGKGVSVKTVKTIDGFVKDHIAPLGQ